MRDTYSKPFRWDHMDSSAGSYEALHHSCSQNWTNLRGPSKFGPVESKLSSGIDSRLWISGIS